MALDLVDVCADANDAAQSNTLAAFLIVLFSVYIATALFVAMLAIYTASSAPDEGGRARPARSPPPPSAAALFAPVGDVPLVSLRAGLG
jgi:hypothetical protein